MCWTWPASFTVSKWQEKWRLSGGKKIKKRMLQILWCGSLLLCGKASRFVWIYQSSCAYSSKFPCYSRLTIRISWRMNIYGCLNSIHVVLTSMTELLILWPLISFLQNCGHSGDLHDIKARSCCSVPNLEHVVVCHTWVPLLSHGYLFLYPHSPMLCLILPVHFVSLRQLLNMD